MSALIEISNLSCSYGERSVLSELSFSIKSGEFVSVVGPNGSGKTTLLRCLLGLVPASGGISLFGQQLNRWARKELARKIAYVPQIVADLPDFSVEEFVLMGRYPHLGALAGGSSQLAKARDALDAVGVGDFAQRNINTLSGGERQKVLLAAALCQEADVMLLDEPAAFLDPHHEQQIYAALEDLNTSHGKTLLVVSHDLNRAAISSERAIALSDGQLRYDGAAEQLIGDAVLQSVYGASFTYVAHPVTGQKMILPQQAPKEGGPLER